MEEGHRGDVSSADHDYASVGQFIEVLSEVSGWYTLATLLGAPTVELDEIQQLYRAEGIMRCLIEVYKCLERRGKPLSWEAIANALKRMKFEKIADKIYTSYIKSSQASNDPCPVQTEDGLSIISKIATEYKSLFNRFDYILSRIKKTFRDTGDVDLTEMQDIARRQCGLAPLPQRKATFNAVFNRIEEQSSIVNFNVIEIIVERLLDEQNCLRIQAELRKFKLSVDCFKSSANMVELVSLIKTEQTTPNGEQKVVKLKVREFWNDFTMKQFETIVNEIFLTLYDVMRHVTVTKGCICLNWIIPDIDTTDLLPVLPLELVRLIGVIYLHIGSDVIYNIEGEGCESIEAAMLQAIELKNTRAIELLLAVGCKPEVANYNGDNAVTNIVNIRDIESKESSSSGSSHSVDHVCILGRNKHVEAIVDPASGGSEPEECSSCIVNKKMVKHLHQEVADLRQNQKILHCELDSLNLTIKIKDSELEELKFLRAEEKEKLIIGDQSLQTTPNPVELTHELIKMKDAEIALLKKSFESLKREMLTIKDEAEEKTGKVKNNIFKSHSSIQPDECAAVLPCQKRRVGIKAEMKVKVIARDRNSGGKELATGGLSVMAVLTCNEEACPVTDNNDGTYTVSVIPQQLGQHQLYITVNGRYIQGSPFSLDIVPQHDYTKLKKPVQTITGISEPKCIAFSNTDNMFVTSSGSHRIHVYSKRGYKKTTIGYGEGSDKLQFQYPCGIDINGDIVYVAELDNHRIHQLTMGGEFIGVFGKEGSAIGEFNNPYDVKISPDGKVYVADTFNHRVQVFNPDWTVSHVINGGLSSDGHYFSYPESIAFDPLSGNVHVSGRGSSSVAVFTSSGQFARRYGNERRTERPTGIAIDPSGYCLVNDYNVGLLSVFDSNGTFVQSFGEFKYPFGVSVSPIDGSVWIADNNGLHRIKFATTVKPLP